jgi:hypothetical protein
MIQFNHNGFAEQKSVFALESADKINSVLAQLPVATPLKVWTTDFDAETPETAKAVENFKAIYVTSEKESGVVNVPTNRYEIVSHKTAMRPIIDALVQSGVRDFQFNAQATLSWANLNIFVGGAGHDGVKLGFQIGNSFDSSSAVSYGAELSHSKSYVVLQGYRQVCSNGLKIKVPLMEAEIVKEETRTQLTTLFKERTRVLHTKSAESKIEAIQYVVEAISLLKQPVENMIKKAQKWTINDSTHFKELIKLHVGRRFATKVINQYNKDSEIEGDSLWALVQAMTAVASHDPSLSTTARETLIDKASEMLVVEMFPKPEVKA